MTASLHILQQHLETELVLVQRFIGILQAESNALEQPDQGEALDNSTQQKNVCIAQLAEAGQAREAALAELGYATSRTGLEQVAAAYPDLAPICAKLFELGQQASELNAANGVIIDTYLKHTQQALQAMRHLTGDTDLYNASGRSAPVKGKRTSITAG